jgi:hypothetical protein
MNLADNFPVIFRHRNSAKNSGFSGFPVSPRRGDRNGKISTAGNGRQMITAHERDLAVAKIKKSGNSGN